MNVFCTVLIILAWPVYLALFLGRSGPGTERSRQDPVSKIGILFQAAGVAVMWGWRRPLFSPLTELTFPVSVAAPVVAVLIALGSVWFSWLALRTLGEQWSFVAGVTARHRLIQDGPYSIVRHPLYVCFFGLTFATALVWSRPAAMPVLIILFWIGIWIRVKTEERILRDTFGAEFERYVRRVPAFFPLWWQV